MFTGIIKQKAVVVGLEKQGSNLTIRLESELSKELAIDQSVAHDGICLTVVAIEGNQYSVTAIDETILKTTVGTWQLGKEVNLELAMIMGSRLDGHVVQGHVDTVGECVSIEHKDGSHLFTFSFPAEFAALIIEKGSICINGVSLTAFSVTNTTFQVAIIPYTFEHTGFCLLQKDQKVNLEFDILGKYFLRSREIEGRK